MRTRSLIATFVFLALATAGPIADSAPKIRGGGAAGIGKWTCGGAYCGPYGHATAYTAFQLLGAVRLNGKTFSGQIQAHPSGVYTFAETIKSLPFHGRDATGQILKAICSVTPTTDHRDAEHFRASCSGRIGEGPALPFKIRIDTATLPLYDVDLIGDLPFRWTDGAGGYFSFLVGAFSAAS